MPAVSVPLKTQMRAWITRGRASRLVSGFVLVALLTVFGKGVSFVKDAALARWFGTSDSMDAFVLAFGFLGFLASVLGGLALLAADVGLSEPSLALSLDAQAGALIGEARRVNAFHMLESKAFDRRPGVPRP